MIYEICWLDSKRQQMGIYENGQLIYMVDFVKRNLLGGCLVLDPRTRVQILHIKYKPILFVPGFRVKGVNNLRVDGRASFLTKYKLSKTSYRVDMGQEHYMDLFYHDQKVGSLDYHPNWERTKSVFEIELESSEHLLPVIGVSLGHYLCESQMSARV